MINKMLILVGTISFLIGQDTYLAQQVVLNAGGTAYLVSDNEESSIGSHGITIGQPVVGDSYSTSYDIDFGFWPEYVSYGCTDNIAYNYNENAVTDDRSCLYRYSIPLQSGQNLISFLALPDNSSVSSTLTNVQTAESVISQGQAANNLIGIGWVGSLTHLNLEDGYWLSVNANDEYSIFLDHPLECNDITYSLQVGPNLISFPCPGQYDVNNAIPDWVQPHISGIIGEGVAAIGTNGQFIGSLHDLEGSKGYWFNATIDLEFNFEQ